MKRFIILGLIAVVLFIGIGIVLTAIPKVRSTADGVSCQNNLREIGLFAAQNADPEFDRAKAATSVPAGTIYNPELLPYERLSWYVTVLPGFDQKRQNMSGVLDGIDRRAGWNAEQNRVAARTKIVALVCPGNPPEVPADQPAATCYVGIGGLGMGAQGLAWTPDGTPSPRSGCYRYDAPTPFSAISDGLSQTLLIGEHSDNWGAWLKGDGATVRELDNWRGAKPLQGPGGQFGGNHANGANWAFADGSVRVFTDRVDAKVLYGLSTIAGKETDVLPGD